MIHDLRLLLGVTVGILLDGVPGVAAHIADGQLGRVPCKGR